MDEFQRKQAEYISKLEETLEAAAARYTIDGLRLSQITNEALAAFKQDWQNHPDRLVDWNWMSVERTPPKHFGFAIWHDGQLCGLASGKLTGLYVRVDFIERFPGANPLKRWCIPIVLTCAQLYALRLGKADFRIYDVDPELIPLYEGHGLELAPDSGKVHVMQRKST